MGLLVTIVVLISVGFLGLGFVTVMSISMAFALLTVMRVGVIATFSVVIPFPVVAMAMMRLVQRLGFLPIVFFTGPESEDHCQGDAGSENLAMHAVW